MGMVETKVEGGRTGEGEALRMRKGLMERRVEGIRIGRRRKRGRRAGREKDKGVERERRETREEGVTHRERETKLGRGGCRSFGMGGGARDGKRDGRETVWEKEGRRFERGTERE